MPRVSQQYRDARRREILEAAGRCFAENGFHSTSMQDFFAASGLTAGLVYRYFRSKDELIATLAADALEQLHTGVEEAIGADEPPTIEQVLARLLRTIDDLDARERLPRVAVQVWAEAIRNPTVGPITAAGIARLQAVLERLVRSAQAAGQLDRGLDPVYAARVLYSILPGFILQRALDPTFDRAAYERAALALVAGQLHVVPS
jgi:TetR/AcrR family transcriptional regulator, transcriptional repressor of aconitase